MTLVVVPDWMWVTLTTAGSKVEMSRATMVEMAGTMAQAAGMGSIVAWGAEPWPPAPVTVMWNSSALASIGPARPAITPAATLVEQWRA